LSLTGNFLTAQQAADWGLANRVVAPNELIPAAKKLAADMLSLVPEALSGYKRLIDQGYAETFGDALKTELKFSGAANKSVRSADIEARRESIRQRGQIQKG
jgi:enoyl-CoA hydratase